MKYFRCPHGWEWKEEPVIVTYTGSTAPAHFALCPDCAQHVLKALDKIMEGHNEPAPKEG